MWPQDVSPQSLLPEELLYHVAFPIQVTPVLLGAIEGAGDLLEGSGCSDLAPEEQLSPLNLPDFARVPIPGG